MVCGGLQSEWCAVFTAEWTMFSHIPEAAVAVLLFWNGIKLGNNTHLNLGIQRWWQQCDWNAFRNVALLSIQVNDVVYVGKVYMEAGAAGEMEVRADRKWSQVQTVRDIGLRMEVVSVKGLLHNVTLLLPFQVNEDDCGEIYVRQVEWKWSWPRPHSWEKDNKTKTHSSQKTMKQ